MRGGLRGFYVFITCIALGCMAIAGVGSLAGSLADGLARQGRVILGGDLSFTLVQQELTPDERTFLDRHGKLSGAATMRAMARMADGKATLVEIKAVDGAYPLFGQAVLDPPGQARRRLGAARRRVRRRRRPGLVDTARYRARRAAHRRQRPFRNPRHTDQRAGQARRRHRLRPAPAGEPGRAARHRPVAARQPGALALSPAPARERLKRCRGQGGHRAGAQRISRSRLGHPQPQQRLAAARAQCRALYAIPHHRRPDRAAGRRRRRRQCGEKPSRPPPRNHRHHEGARRVGKARVRDLSHASPDAGGDRRRHRPGVGRDAAVPDFVDLRRHHSAADRAGAASGRTCAGAALWADDGGHLRAVAARARA